MNIVRFRFKRYIQKMATTTKSQFYDEDEVCRKTEDGRYIYGLVVESSEYLSSDDEDGDDRLSDGTVRVAWHPDGKETVEEEKGVR